MPSNFGSLEFFGFILHEQCHEGTTSVKCFSIYFLIFYMHQLTTDVKLQDSLTHFMKTKNYQVYGSMSEMKAGRIQYLEIYLGSIFYLLL